MMFFLWVEVIEQSNQKLKTILKGAMLYYVFYRFLISFSNVVQCWIYGECLVIGDMIKLCDDFSSVDFIYLIPFSPFSNKGCHGNRKKTFFQSSWQRMIKGKMLHQKHESYKFILPLKKWIDWISRRRDKMSQPQKSTFWEKLASYKT